MNTKLALGDGATWYVPLTKNNRSAYVASMTFLLSCKDKPETQDDTLSRFQKASGAGISVVTVNSIPHARIELVRDDTVGLEPGRYYYDLKGQVSGQSPVTFGPWELELFRTPTRGTTTSVPVHTAQPPYPAGLSESQVRDIAEEEAGSAIDAADLPANYAAKTHTHTIAQVDGLRGELDSKQPSGSYATPSQISAAIDAIPEATPTAPGHMSAGDKEKLDGVQDQLDDKANAQDVADALALKAPKENPSFTGTVSINGADLAESLALLSCRLPRFTIAQLEALSSLDAYALGAALCTDTYNMFGVLTGGPVFFAGETDGAKTIWRYFGTRVRATVDPLTFFRSCWASGYSATAGKLRARRSYQENSYTLSSNGGSANPSNELDGTPYYSVACSTTASSSGRFGGAGTSGGLLSAMAQCSARYFSAVVRIPSYTAMTSGEQVMCTVGGGYSGGNFGADALMFICDTTQLRGSGASNSNWHLFSRSAGVSSIVDTGYTPNANDYATLECLQLPGEISVYVNGAAVSPKVTTNLQLGALALGASTLRSSVVGAANILFRVSDMYAASILL